MTESGCGKNSIMLIMKPTSACNMRCAYCYHSGTGYSGGVLDTALLEKLIRLAETGYDEVRYIWHGGEPLLTGHEYFREIVRLEERYRRPGQRISNGVQTNGTLLDDEYLDFFEKNGFSVSVSFDGPGICNDLRGETDAVDAVLRKIASRPKLGPASISVVHADNAGRQIEMYEYFKGLGIPMKFNPMFPDGSAMEIPDKALTAGEYTAELGRLFDHWLKDPCAVPVEPIEQFLNILFGRRGKDCVYGSCLYRWLGVDSKGDIYPCGRSYTEEYMLGNIAEVVSLQEVFDGPAYGRLARGAILRRENCLAACEYYGMCQGGCNSRSIMAGDIEAPDPFNCYVLKEMINYMSRRIRECETACPRDMNPIVRKLLAEGEMLI